ncbi:hypothetical protein VTH06DRAFT_2946, partial [Thermothelomyces fergusii]
GARPGAGRAVRAVPRGDARAVRLGRGLPGARRVHAAPAVSGSGRAARESSSASAAASCSAVDSLVSARL